MYWTKHGCGGRVLTLNANEMSARIRSTVGFEERLRFAIMAATLKEADRIKAVRNRKTQNVYNLPLSFEKVRGSLLV